MLVLVTSAPPAAADMVHPECISELPVFVPWYGPCDPLVGDGPWIGDAPDDMEVPLGFGWWSGVLFDGDDVDTFSAARAGSENPQNPGPRLRVQAPWDGCLRIEVVVDGELSQRIQGNGEVHCDGAYLYDGFFGNPEIVIRLSDGTQTQCDALGQQTPCLESALHDTLDAACTLTGVACPPGTGPRSAYYIVYG